jgi:hypothetical protein
MGGLAPDTKRALTHIFDYVLSQIRFGRPDHQTAAQNLPGQFYQATTPASANTEFSVPHFFAGTAPYLLIPVLPLDVVNGQIVPLKVTRAADTQRVYLSSSATSAPVAFYLEG